MKASIGMTFMINIIVVFLVLTFVFMAGTISYSKAFKVNSKVVNILEKYEGYNYKAKEEIDLMLGSIGYKTGDSSKCPQEKNGGTLVTASSFANNPSREIYSYCIYYYKVDNNKNETEEHYTYGITTYMDIDIPIISNFIQVPIYAKTRRIWRFNIATQNQGI